MGCHNTTFSSTIVSQHNSALGKVNLIYFTYNMRKVNFLHIRFFSYRIEHVFDEVLSIMTSKRCCPYCTKIISAIHIHRRATQLVSFQNLHLF